MDIINKTFPSNASTVVLSQNKNLQSKINYSISQNKATHGVGKKKIMVD
jgi:hypothetical protein